MHVAVIAAALYGLPWTSNRSMPPLRVTDVSFFTEAEFQAAMLASTQRPATPPAPPTEEAPTPTPAPVVDAPTPAPAEPVTEPAPAPAPEAAPPTVAMPAAPDAGNAAAPEPPRPPAAVIVAAPPPPRPADRVDPTPAPPPPDLARPDDQFVPETAPAPLAETFQPERPATAPEQSVAEVVPDPVPEPDPQPVPETRVTDLPVSARPLGRAGNMARPAPEPAPQATAAATPPPTPTPTPAPPAAPSSQASSSQPSAPTQGAVAAGPPLTQGEKDGLKFAITQCWNVPAGLRDAQDLRVVVGAELAADGAVIAGSIRLIEPNPIPDPRYQQAFEAGRRALIRCSPYSGLPRDKFGQWRNIEVVFNPEGMVSW